MILKSRELEEKYLQLVMKSQDFHDRCNPGFDVYICHNILKIAHVIGKGVWNQKGDIRDVISIGKLVRNNDGPVEVEQILSTMVKYGEIREH
jgi:hypothetical protein